MGDLQYLSNVELYSHNVETICMFNLVIYPGGGLLTGMQYNETVCIHVFTMFARSLKGVR